VSNPDISGRVIERRHIARYQVEVNAVNLHEAMVTGGTSSVRIAPTLGPHNGQRHAYIPAVLRHDAPICTAVASQANVGRNWRHKLGRGDTRHLRALGGLLDRELLLQALDLLLLLSTVLLGGFELGIALLELLLAGMQL
jgi:hypothetical protein